MEKADIDSLANGQDDSYEKVSIDSLFLIDKVEIIKKKIEKTPWYHIGTHIKLWKELKVLGKETDKIGERLQKLDEEIDRSPIQIVKRT